MWFFSYFAHVIYWILKSKLMYIDITYTMYHVVNRRFLSFLPFIQFINTCNICIIHPYRFALFITWIKLNSHNNVDILLVENSLPRTKKLWHMKSRNVSNVIESEFGMIPWYLKQEKNYFLLLLQSLCHMSLLFLVFSFLFDSLNLTFF